MFSTSALRGESGSRLFAGVGLPGFSPRPTLLPVSREEYAVWLFLSENPESAFSRREIARRAVKRTVFEENPYWADEALNALVARGVVEVDEQGHYRLKRAGAA